MQLELDRIFEFTSRCENALVLGRRNPEAVYKQMNRHLKEPGGASNPSYLASCKNRDDCLALQPGRYRVSEPPGDLNR